ncbi:putative T7SS-secreted protein [Streptomyces sp. NPDC126497]|uniref:putative T7SS-secreted protein n=1 Tax=Streptomyces sp. NPDC126497 TaxID=3155313 RepID=UPI00331D5B0F
MSTSSKPRPRDWHPIANSDPVPGDPEEIRDEVTHMKSVATTLREQARRLRDIKNDDELKGKYAGKLREESEVLEKHLREVASRYERVHVHLTKWANELEGFQTEADKVLANAKKEQEQLEAEKNKKESEEGTPKPSTSDAEGDPLREYRIKLDTITSDRDDRAAYYAGKIRDEIDDIIEDSFWDDIKGWIHDNIDKIKWVLDALGWAASILGTLAPFLAFIPIIGPFIGAIALGLSIFIAASRFVLFLAGEASITEVLMDCVGLVAFATGTKMLAKLKTASKAVNTASKTQRTQRLKDALRANRAVRNEITRVMATTSDDGLREFGRQTLNRMRKEMSQNAGRVADEVPLRPSQLERLGFGDAEARSVINSIRQNSDTFPSAAAAAGKSETYYKTAVAAAVTGATADVVDKTLGESPVFPDKPFNSTYENFKGETGKLPEDTHW